MEKLSLYGTSIITDTMQNDIQYVIVKTNFRVESNFRFYTDKFGFGSTKSVYLISEIFSRWILPSYRIFCNGFVFCLNMLVFHWFWRNVVLSIYTMSVNLRHIGIEVIYVSSRDRNWRLIRRIDKLKLVIIRVLGYTISWSILSTSPIFLF